MWEREQSVVLTSEGAKRICANELSKLVWDIWRVHTDEFGTTILLGTWGGKTCIVSPEDIVQYVPCEVKWGSPIEGNHDPRDYPQED